MSSGSALARLEESFRPVGPSSDFALERLDDEPVPAHLEGPGAAIDGLEESFRDVDAGRHKYIVEYIQWTGKHPKSPLELP
jgi:hypothetical protein